VICVIGCLLIVSNITFFFGKDACIINLMVPFWCVYVHMYIWNLSSVFMYVKYP
jgi:hypothetical protein